MSVVGNIANQRRIEEQASQDRAVNACANQIAEFYIKANYAFRSVSASEEDVCLETLLGCWQCANWTEKTRAKVFRLAAHRAYGDPMALTKDQLRLRQHATQYYNPESRPITVEPMGLPDEDGNVIKAVCPGGLINIPHGYVTGGKRSVVNTTAPQLVPMPRIEAKGNVLDLTPTTYQEWLTYYPATPSPCCNRCIMWSDKLQTLMCEVCRKPVNLSTGVR